MFKIAVRRSIERCRELAVPRFQALRDRLGKGWGRAIAPAILAVTLIPFTIPLLAKELNEPLFGDTAMMQYTAWAIRHGMRLYKDTGSTDGPFIHFAQAIIQMLLGPATARCGSATSSSRSQAARSWERCWHRVEGSLSSRAN